MSEVIQDIRDYFADRFSNPFWISFVVAWLVINWELPISAIFETDIFNATVIASYLANTSSWHTWWLPVILAITYSILSSSFREIIEILSKFIRSIFSYIDRKQLLYKSISFVEHEKQIARLERRLKKMDKDKEELTELSLENKRLEEENASLRLELKDKDDCKEHNSKLTVENERLLNELNSSTGKQLINISEKQKKSTANHNLKYLQKIKSYCNQDTIASLEDPYSRANLLLILESFGNSTPYSRDEIKNELGISNEMFGKIFNLANEARLIEADSARRTVLTEEGKQKLQELRNDANIYDLLKAINTIDSETSKHIISTLEVKSLTLKDIQNTVSYNHNLLKILNDLASKNIIHKVGSVYFHGPSNNPEPERKTWA